MSARPYDGGPAFPRPASVDTSQGTLRDGDRLIPAEDGMSLRDYFAARAMHAELMTCTVPGEAADALLEACRETGENPLDRMASNAYGMADAMIRARSAT